MSGLEVLGAVASAVQLTNTCLEIAKYAVDLFSRVRHTPETVRRRVEDVEQLVEISKLIEQNPSLQTALMTSVLARANAETHELLKLLKKIDPQPTAGQVVIYWKALKGVVKEGRILAICDKLQDIKASLTHYCQHQSVSETPISVITKSAHRGRDYLRELNMEFVTVRQEVDGIFKELPAIRDTARKAMIILNELAATSSKISSPHDELPMMSGKITTIHDDIPVLVNKVTVIHDELPAIRDALERLSLRQKAREESIPAQSRQNLFVMPFDRDEDFVNREDIICSIDRTFSESRSVRRVALAGLGGIGKTQIAIEYAHRLREKSPDIGVFWVHASNPSRIELSYRAIVTAANFPEANKSNQDILNMMLRWLENGINTPWFMILDNADDITMFFPQISSGIPQMASDTGSYSSMSLYHPRTGGSMLITSRNFDLAIRLTGKLERVIEVDKLGDSDALELLGNKISADVSPKTDWVALIDALDRLPLALSQAAAYIAMRRPRMSVSKYLDYFRSDELKQITLLSIDWGGWGGAKKRS